MAKLLKQLLVVSSQDYFVRRRDGRGKEGSGLPRGQAAQPGTEGGSPTMPRMPTLFRQTDTSAAGRSRPCLGFAAAPFCPVLTRVTQPPDPHAHTTISLLFLSSPTAFSQQQIPICFQPPAQSVNFSRQPSQVCPHKINLLLLFASFVLSTLHCFQDKIAL